MKQSQKFALLPSYKVEAPKCDIYSRFGYLEGRDIIK